MPWWAVVYVVVFVAFSIIGDALMGSDGSRRFGRLADQLAAAVFAVLFVGFWAPSIYRALGMGGPILVSVAIAWELYSLPKDVRDMWKDPELSRKEHIALTLLPPLLVWPLIITAVVGVFRFYARG